MSLNTVLRQQTTSRSSRWSTVWTRGIRRHIRSEAPRWPHRLPWTVYAAEIGYLYSGDEYWQTFEERTPGWSMRGRRHWLKKCFIDFHNRYGGANPSGPWARKFSIICWHITHAILPRDLQRHLAKILYDLRHTLSQEALSNPRRLGELIESHSRRTVRALHSTAPCRGHCPRGPMPSSVWRIPP